jgi:hypothetical protein
LLTSFASISSAGRGRRRSKGATTLDRREAMICKSCTSDNRLKFTAEINIHFDGWEGLKKPGVLVFPKLLVCMDCGFTEFVIPERELSELAGGYEK